MDQKKRTEIASLGQFGLIDLLTSGFTPKNASTLKGAGDDAAVIAPGRGEAVLCTTGLLLRRRRFRPHLFSAQTPGLQGRDGRRERHPGHERPPGADHRVARRLVETARRSPSGPLRRHRLRLQGAGDRPRGRRHARLDDGTGHHRHHAWLRQKGERSSTAAVRSRTTSSASRATSGPPTWACNCSNAKSGCSPTWRTPSPQFKGYEYLLEKYLKPRPRTDIVRALAEEKIRPTSMIDLSDGWRAT